MLTLASTKSITQLLLFAAFSLAAPLTYGAPNKKRPPVPDFTKGDQIGERHDWNLGPTGARGWMWGWKTETTQARQIYVTKVDQGSPAEGILKIGDVILGVGQQPFTQDARHAFGSAIASAEATDGKLPLTRWRDGETQIVTLQLAALGSYRESSPHDCLKSERILAAGCEHIAKRLNRDFTKLRKPTPDRAIAYRQTEITAAVDALALLASGKEDYSELIAKYAHAFAPADLKLHLNPDSGMASWGWGYINLFLCEYHLATGDASVLPAIEKYSVAIAKGQSFIGSWGHSMAWPSVNGGKLHGSLMGYGALNSAGLICHLALVLGEKCGVENTEVEQAIEKANQFIGFYSGKGSIPYGDHFPGEQYHDDNGKNSMAAVLFDLQEMSDAVHFFSSMTVASYLERESGHTGNYFSFLWGPLGAQRAGNDASAAFLKPQRWFYDLNRAWDGSFTYQGKADAKGGENSYNGWDSTGAFMLTYALPLKKLYITGKGTSEDNLLTKSNTASLIADGAAFHTWDRGMSHYKQRSSAELLENLKSWSPAVRLRAAQALAEKPNPDKSIPQLIEMLSSESLATRYGACQGLGAMKELSKDAVPELQKQLSAKDTWLRIQSAFALSNIGKEAAPAIPELLKLATTLDSADPLQMTQRFLAFGLFDSKGTYSSPGLLSRSVKDIDRDLLYKVVKQLLNNPDGRTRGTVESVYRSLTFEELKPLFPAILDAIEKPSPSGVMFSSNIRISGLELLAKYRIEEGMPLCLQIMEIKRWGKNARIKKCLEALAVYGSAAKPLLPQIRQFKKDLLTHPESRMLAPRIKEVTELIQALESSTESIELRSLKSN